VCSQPQVTRAGESTLNTTDRPRLRLRNAVLFIRKKMYIYCGNICASRR
jgi:hypothetical protein